jgi:hypothetical protein
MGEIPLIPRRPEIFSHLVEGDVNDLVDIEDGNAALKICQSVFDAIMNLCACPHEAVLELFKNIGLSGSFGGISFPAAPVSIIVEIILPGAGLKDSVARYGPGEFVFEGTHFLVLILIKIRRMNTYSRSHPP